jgi:hypothetical protein
MPNWDILTNALQPPRQQDGPSGFQDAFERGLTRSLMSRLAANPRDEEALQQLWALNPQYAAAMERRADGVGEQVTENKQRDALAEYVLGQNGGTPTNALAASVNTGRSERQRIEGTFGDPMRGNRPPQVSPEMGGVNALLGSSQGAGGPPPAPLPGANSLALPPVTGDGWAIPAAPLSADAQPAFGQAPGAAPAGGNSAAWERAVRMDPQAALETQGRVLANQHRSVQFTREQFQMASELTEANFQLLGGVLRAPAEQRPALYRQAIERARGLYGRYGIDISQHVPAEYDEAAVMALMRSTMKTRDQFEQMTREDRLEWDIEDDRIDNSEQRRHNQTNEGNARRGQDLTDSRVRRGQDIASTDRRRGQDLGSTDGGGARAELNGRTIVVRNDRWVYEDTGRPVG